MRALAPWRPFRELSTLHEDIDELFTHFFGPEQEWFPTRWQLATPRIESFVRNGELVVRADLPGIDPKKVELAVEANRLMIRGEREVKEEHKGKDYLHREVAYGRFERALDLPAGVDTESIKAIYHDGVLEVTMKAPKEMVAKKVPITVH
ncbi:MAG TPA: Hsp20/alpha crystallin family protein [Candidatus Acidoferrales bacterium]|nr:Hsp20/alpha crystallin family protein [Candidatus Acidoferrales bacterium]